MAISYKDAGVDVTEGYRAVDMMKKHVKSTFDENVLMDIGSFGGFYSIENFKLEKPVLVAGTDGVGTKLKYAFESEKFDTVGIDCVAMCVNDIVCQGAKPLMFLDYIATGKMFAPVIAEIVKGVADGCRQAGCALVGGETAEMPGFYPVGEYDLAGFSVGIGDRDKLITGKDIKAGDVLIGLPSTGVHSNGYSLVRKLFNPEDKALMATFEPRLGKTYMEAFMTPTRIYVKAALEFISKVTVKGIAHVTGGGFIENLPRILPKDKGLGIEVDKTSYELPELFKILIEKAGITEEQAYNTFNMGIGMVFAVAAEDKEKALAVFKEMGETAYAIGTVTAEEGFRLC